MTRWTAIVGLAVLVLGCAKSRIGPTGETESEDQVHFVATVGSATSVALTVTDRKWSASTQAILMRHTVLWVELHNGGAHPVRVAPDDFSLVVGADRHSAIDAEKLVHDGIPGSLGESRVARASGFRSNTLAPGQRAKGYLFFRFRVDAEKDAAQPVSLSVNLRDGEQAVVLEELEVNLAVIQ